MQKRIFAEYINQIVEDMPGTCTHKKAEYIVRCHNCEYFVIPKTEYENMWCKKLLCDVQPNCFCCWGKHVAVTKKGEYYVR